MKYSEVFEILERHGFEPHMLTAEHDIISISMHEDQTDDLVDDSEWEELEDAGFFFENGILVKYV